MNSILTKCFSCCGRQNEISNNVFNLKEIQKLSNSSLNIYSKLKSKGTNSVTNLKKTNETNQKKYSFVNFPLSSEEDISSKQKVKSENSFSIKKKPTKKKVTYRDDIINEKNSKKKSPIKRNSSFSSFTFISSFLSSFSSFSSFTFISSFLSSFSSFSSFSSISSFLSSLSSFSSFSFTSCCLNWILNSF